MQRVAQPSQYIDTELFYQTLLVSAQSNYACVCVYE